MVIGFEQKTEHGHILRRKAHQHAQADLRGRKRRAGFADFF
jgi:hypothetical protein